MQYKISENFGIIFKARKLLEFKSLLSLYFSFLKKLSSHEQKLALGLIFKNGKFESVEFDALKYLLPSFKALHINIQSVSPKKNLYELNRKQKIFKSAISSLAPLLWNKILSVTIKSRCFLFVCKKEVKENLANLENESNFFNYI